MSAQFGSLVVGGIVCLILTLLLVDRAFKDALPKRPSRKLPDDTQGRQ